MKKQLVIIAVLLGFAAVSYSQDCPPKPETWPSVKTPLPDMWWTPFVPRFHGDNPQTRLGGTFERRCNMNSEALDMGSLRCQNGKWEVLGTGTNCDTVTGWCPYDSKNAGQSFWIKVNSRYGCGPSGGHGHGIDAYVYPSQDYKTATGKPLIFGSIEHIDTWYHPTLYKWIESEARKNEGPQPLCPNRVCDTGEDSVSCPQDCIGVEPNPDPNPNPEPDPEEPTDPVEPPVDPINPNCNNICNEPDRICENGKLVGGKCPSDCDPCTPITKPPEPPIVPPVNAASCKPFTDPLNETIHSLESEIESLSKIPILPEYLSVLYREEKSRALSGKLGVCTRYNRYIPQLCAMYLCPSDLVRVTCKRSGV